MEQKIYDVLCNIHKELSNLRTDMADVKLELKSIQGDGEDYYEDDYGVKERWTLCDVIKVLSDIKSDMADIQSDMADVKSELKDIHGSDGDTANLFEIYDRIYDIKHEVADISFKLE